MKQNVLLLLLLLLSKRSKNECSLCIEITYTVRTKAVRLGRRCCLSLLSSSPPRIFRAPLIVFNHCYDVLFSYNKPITILLIRLFITELFITLDDDDKYNPLFKQFVELIKWIWHIDRIEIDKCNYGTPTSLVFDSYRGRFKKMKITHIIQEYMYHLELKIFGNERLGRSSFIQLKGTVELT